MSIIVTVRLCELNIYQVRQFYIGEHAKWMKGGIWTYS